MCANCGTCMHYIRPKDIQNMYLSISGLFVQPFPSPYRPGLLTPTVQSLILYQRTQPAVATVAPLICSPRHTHTQDRRTMGKVPSFDHKDEPFTLTGLFL